MNTARREPLVVQLPDTGASPIRFAGAGPLTDSRTQMTSVILGVPSGIQAGDVMIAQILIYDGAGTDVPSAPAGWAVIRHDAINGGGNQMTSWLYYKVADSIEPPSYAWNISLQYAAGVMRAWRGALASSPIDQSSGATAAGTNPVSVQAPSLTSANNNELQVYFYGAQAFAAPIITEPATITERLNEMSTQEGFTLAFGDLAAPPGGTVSPTYVAMATSNIPDGSPPVMAAQAVLLVPAGLDQAPTPSPTSTSTATSIPAETATATPSAAATASASATQSGTPQPTASAVATSFGRNSGTDSQRNGYRDGDTHSNYDADGDSDGDPDRDGQLLARIPEVSHKAGRHDEHVEVRHHDQSQEKQNCGVDSRRDAAAPPADSKSTIPRPPASQVIRWRRARLARWRFSLRRRLAVKRAMLC